MNVRINIIVALLVLAMSAMCLRAETSKHPKTVIFDTDMGNDIDDLLALQILINYEKAGKISIAGIAISKDNPLAAEVTERYYNRYGIGNPQFGRVYDGPNKDTGNYLEPVLCALKKGCIPVNKEKEEKQEAWEMMRKILIASPDSSVTIISTGPTVNLARLLMSLPDSLSCLDGRELVSKKVRLLSIMGGDYSGSGVAEWNILQDIPSSRYVLDEWCGELVASGFEIGKNILFPHQCIESGFSQNHPLRIGYEHFLQMPYDRPCWDLTSVLYAIEPDGGWFDFSDRGKININEDGVSEFMPSADGTHRYLRLKRDDLSKILTDRAASNCSHK